MRFKYHKFCSTYQSLKQKRILQSIVHTSLKYYDLKLITKSLEGFPKLSHGSLGRQIGKDRQTTTKVFAMLIRSFQ